MKILIVDDNQAILDSLNTLLSAHGYLVSTAGHGLAGAVELKSTTYDLLIIDHLMPVMNGIQLTKHLRQIECYTNTPLIFLTTQGHKSVSLVCDTNLFTAIVDKPINEVKLLKLINDLLSSNTRHQLL